MALETNQDLENFFDTETHGSDVTVTINGTGISIKVIINKEYFANPLLLKIKYKIINFFKII